MPRTCSNCKLPGHTKPTCPTVPKNVIVTAPAAPPPAPASASVSTGDGIPFVIPDNSNAAWAAWASQDYDCFQPIVELIDNAIAAITKFGIFVIFGMIYITFDPEKNVGSIEHSGGTTFSLDPIEIARCFTYGEKCPTRLNEHGCGLKSSLAILDPYNTSWKIYIKYVHDGVLKVKSICAPYTSSMTLRDEAEWPGQNKTAEPGTYITFPLDKRRFSRLYAKKEEASMKDLHERIKCHLTHMWMKMDEMVEGKIQMFYNGDRLTPFSFGSESLREYVNRIDNKTFALSTCAVVDVQHIVLTEGKGKTKLPGSYMFKRAMTANGAYLYKNGRFIEAINDNEAARGNLYTAIFGSVPDNHHNGNIVLVNMKGEQAALPPSVPTKNRFQSHELFDELLDKLKDNIAIVVSKVEKEAVLADEYTTKLEKSIKSVFPHATFEREKSFKLSDDVRTPPIDLVMTVGVDRSIMEFKRNVLPTVGDIEQLMMNWILAQNSPENEGKTLKPVLVVRALAPGEQQRINDTIKTYLGILKTRYGFQPVIQTTDNTVLPWE